MSCLTQKKVHIKKLKRVHIHVRYTDYKITVPGTGWVLTRPPCPSLETLVPGYLAFYMYLNYLLYI